MHTKDNKSYTETQSGEKISRESERGEVFVNTNEETCSCISHQDTIPMSVSSVIRQDLSLISSLEYVGSIPSYITRCNVDLVSTSTLKSTDNIPGLNDLLQWWNLAPL